MKPMQTWPSPSLKGLSKEREENPQLYAEASKQYKDLQKASRPDHQKSKEPEQKP